MKLLLLAIAAAGIAISGEPDVAGPGNPVTPVPRAAGKPARQRAGRRSPLRFLKHLGATEVDLAMRLSSWGIHNPETAGGHANPETTQYVRSAGENFTHD